MRRNSVLDELRVKRLAVIHEESVLKTSNARIKVQRIEGEEKLSIISADVIV